MTSVQSIYYTGGLLGEGLIDVQIRVHSNDNIVGYTGYVDALTNLGYEEVPVTSGALLDHDVTIDAVFAGNELINDPEYGSGEFEIFFGTLGSYDLPDGCDVEGAYGAAL